MKPNSFDNSHKACNVDEVQTLSCQLQSKKNETVDFKQLAIGHVCYPEQAIDEFSDRLFSNMSRVYYTTAIVGPL
jgi:hypothetical protein